MSGGGRGAPPTTNSHAEGTEDWLMSYADFVTVLMGFFVLLFAMSDPDPGKFEEVSKDYSEALTKPLQTPFMDLRKAQTAALSQGSEGAATSTAAVKQRGQVMPFSSDKMFASGSADILPEADPSLDRTAQLVSFGFGRVSYRVTVEAHTDDAAVNPQGKYPSNWEWSAARAAAVARYLISRGVEPSRLVASGRANVDPLPDTVDQNKKLIATPENRAKNRRVVIKIDRS